MISLEGVNDESIFICYMFDWYVLNKCRKSDGRIVRMIRMWSGFFKELSLLWIVCI